MNKQDGSILQTVVLANQVLSQICLSKNKCLILNNSNQGYFMDVAKGMKTAIVFDFYKNAQDKNSQII